MDSPIRARDHPVGWWDRLDQLFEAACALPETQRLAFVQLECADDAELRAELSSLLAHTTAASGTDLSLKAFLSGAEFPPPEAEQDTDRRIGTRLRHFVIEARLGAGGMGTVYRARDLALDRLVALKFMSAVLGEASAKKRFLVEARAGAAIDHPNICTVHEVGETDDGTPFIAMAYYEGETLRSTLSRGPLPIGVAVDYVRQTACGVGAAHACGVLHRDIKPGNIFITRSGVAKLLDFGVAKMGELGLTRSGMVLGTVGYMSPEQLREEAVDGRTDIWSLGVVLFEALLAHPPFRGAHNPQIMRSALLDPTPPMRASRPEVPVALEAVVSRALAKRPDDRYRTVDQFLDELGAAMTPAP